MMQVPVLDEQQQHDRITTIFSFFEIGRDYCNLQLMRRTAPEKLETIYWTALLKKRECDIVEHLAFKGIIK